MYANNSATDCIFVVLVGLEGLWSVPDHRMHRLSSFFVLFSASLLFSPIALPSMWDGTKHPGAGERVYVTYRVP